MSKKDGNPTCSRLSAKDRRTIGQPFGEELVFLADKKLQAVVAFATEESRVSNWIDPKLDREREKGIKFVINLIALPLSLIAFDIRVSGMCSMCSAAVRGSFK